MKTELLETPRVLEKAERVRDLVLHNDDVNTFDFVIETLVEICGHNLLQAEQCAYIVHYKGKCVVKKGSYDDLEPLCLELLRRGLSATID